MVHNTTRVSPRWSRR